MSDNMFKFIMTLLPVFGAIITYFVIPYIKSKVSQTQMEEIIKWVTKAVEAAEVLFDAPKSGEEKGNTLSSSLIRCSIQRKRLSQKNRFVFFWKLRGSRCRITLRPSKKGRVFIHGNNRRIFQC